MNNYLWIPKKGETLGFEHYPGTPQSVAQVFYPWQQEPRVIWSLVDYCDPENPPDIDNVIISRTNCYMLFAGLDYTRWPGVQFLDFHSRFTDGGHWLLLEM